MKRAPLMLAALTLLAVLPAYSRADIVILGTEDPVSGLVVGIATSAPPILVASDGEAPFDPFGAGFNTSDGIQFPSAGVWIPDPRYASAFGPGLWTALSDGRTWVLPEPADESAPEPIGAWILPGAFWNPGTPPLQGILDPDGSLSDLFTVTNNGPNGDAQIIFESGPNLVPEPSSIMLLAIGVGLAGLTSVRLRKKASS